VLRFDIILAKFSVAALWCVALIVETVLNRLGAGYWSSGSRALNGL